jgi:hypothetical protein
MTKIENQLLWSMSMKKLLFLKDRMVAEQIRTFLNENNIDTLMKNSTLQTLFEPGEIGPGYQLAMGPIELWVSDPDMKRALELLSLSIFEDYVRGAFEKQGTGQTGAYRNSVLSAIFFYIWIFGIGNIAGIVFAARGLKREAKKFFAIVFLILNIIGVLASVYIDFLIVRQIL